MITIIELGYRKISWFLSVSQINYLLQPSASASNLSTRHWQTKIFAQYRQIKVNYLQSVPSDLLTLQNYTKAKWQIENSIIVVVVIIIIIIIIITAGDYMETTATFIFNLLSFLS